MRQKTGTAGRKSLPIHGGSISYIAPKREEADTGRVTRSSSYRVTDHDLEDRGEEKLQRKFGASAWSQSSSQ